MNTVVTILTVFFWLNVALFWTGVACWFVDSFRTK